LKTLKKINIIIFWKYENIDYILDNFILLFITMSTEEAKKHYCASQTIEKIIENIDISKIDKIYSNANYLRLLAMDEERREKTYKIF
jgi:hypothetical protein